MAKDEINVPIVLSAFKHSVLLGTKHFVPKSTECYRDVIISSFAIGENFFFPITFFSSARFTSECSHTETCPASVYDMSIMFSPSPLPPGSRTSARGRKALQMSDLPPMLH